jgi:hypothetical protein
MAADSTRLHHEVNAQHAALFAILAVGRPTVLTVKHMVDIRPSSTNISEKENIAYQIPWNLSLFF